MNDETVPLLPCLGFSSALSLFLAGLGVRVPAWTVHGRGVDDGFVERKVRSLRDTEPLGMGSERSRLMARVEVCSETQQQQHLGAPQKS